MKLFKKITTGLMIGSLSLLLCCTKTGTIIKPELLPAGMIYIGGAGEMINVPEAQKRNVSYVLDETNNEVVVSLVIGRSGFQDKEAFSVDVTVDNDSVSKLIEAGKLDNVMLMEDKMYTLDKRVMVEAKTDGGVLQLRLNRTEIGEIGKKKLALGIRIRNPSKYTVNPKFEQAILLIDYRALVGIPCVPDVNAGGRIFFDFPNAGSRDPWYDGGVESTFIQPGKIKLTRNNDDGYGLFVLRDNNFTYNLGTHPILAIHVYETPSEGSWWVRFYDGTKDHDLQPADATVKALGDGSSIYYWNMPQKTGLSGIVKSNVMVVVIGTRGQSITHGWIKTYDEEVVIEQCISN